MTDPSPARVNVPVEPTLEMLQGACENHTPGVPMSEDRPEECRRFETRRRIWRKMVAAAPRPIGEGFGSSAEGADTHRDADGAVVGWKTQVVERLKALWLDIGNPDAEPPTTARILNVLADAKELLTAPDTVSPASQPGTSALASEQKTADKIGEWG